jgi:hypothetical protein
LRVLGNGNLFATMSQGGMNGAGTLIKYTPQ